MAQKGAVSCSTKDQSTCFEKPNKRKDIGGVNHDMEPININFETEHKEEATGESRSATNSYKLYPRDVHAAQLWKKGAIVFLPAKQLLFQFSFQIVGEKMDEVMQTYISDVKISKGKVFHID